MAVDISKIKVKVVTDYFERDDVSTILSRLHPLGEKREVLISGKIEEETLFIITKIPDTEAPPEKLLKLKRQYWEIENLLHYRKDSDALRRGTIF